MRSLLKGFYLAMAMLVAQGLSAQKKEIEIAKSYELMGRFSMALQYYKKAEAREKYLAEEEQVRLYKSLIFCNDKLKDYKNAEKYFEKIEKLQPLSDSLLVKYSEVLRTLGSHPKAEKVYRSLVNKQTDEVLKNNMLYALDWFKKNKSLKQPYVIGKTNINVQGLSMGIAEYNDGVIVGVPKLTDGVTFYNLGYCTKKDSVTFSEATILSKNLTSKFHEGYPVIDQKNNVLYFTSNSLTKVKIKQGGKKDISKNGNVNRLKIYQSTFENGEWSEKEELPFNSMDYDCLHPSISDDGKTLYFTSNMSGGKGGYDIYKVEKTNSGWSKPVNLGSRVNTMGDEMNPFIKAEELFFASRGYYGFGGIDVFKVKLSEEDGKVQNLGAPINTNQDDFSFTMNSKDKGYFSSNRSSKKAEDAIYSYVYYPVNVVTDTENGEAVEDIDVVVSELINGEWKEVSTQRTNKAGEWKYDFKAGVEYKVKFDNSYRNSKEFTLSANGNRVEELEKLKNVDLQRVFIDGYVIDEETQKGIEGVKEILYEKNELGDFEEIDSTFTDEEGYWRFDVEKDKVYEVEIQRVDYELEKIEIDPIVDNEPRRKSYTTTLKVKLNKDNEKVLDAENIFFEHNSANITSASFAVLDQVVGYLKANPYSKLEVDAYTDCTGDDAFNLALSERRAKACADYVIEKIGGKAFRVKYKGFGETNPIHACDEQRNNPDLAAENRRVEFKLVK
ncbi:MAG: OmpA family protein [Flavobacteriales bacterium]|jgi:outer membrane protein OmpA-like peptidoglycan-associated protein|nr:OmpA family protein [Flavobacteriales bacterium]